MLIIFLLLLLLFSIVFGNKKGIWESDQEKCGVYDFREEGARFRDQAPPPPPFRPCDTGRNSTFLIRKEMVRNVKTQTKINIIVSLQLKIKFHLR